MKKYDFVKMLSERKTVSNGIRFRPTVFNILNDLKGDKSINDKIEQLIIEEYKAKTKKDVI